VKTLDDYMNDPSVANEPMPLREVHAIRLMIHDEKKDMTPEELDAYHAQFTENLKRMTRIQFVPSA